MLTSRPSDDDPVTVHLPPDALATALRSEVVEGLTATPKELSPKWLYDDRGCDLFDEITRLRRVLPDPDRAFDPEPTRGTEIGRVSGADTLDRAGVGHVGQDPAAARRHGRVGSPSSDSSPSTSPKPRCATPSRSWPWSTPSVHGARAWWATSTSTSGHPRRRPTHGGVPRRHDRQPPPATSAPSSWPRRRRRWSRATHCCVGTDLVKDRDRLVAAYDDAAGSDRRVQQERAGRCSTESSTAISTPEQFDHVARFDEDGSFIEMRLRSRADQQVVHRRRST